MRNYIEALGTFCQVKKDSLRCIPEAQILTFLTGTATTTIRIVVYDLDTGLHLEITNMTTLPDSEKGKGYGTSALQKVFAWAREYNMQSVTAIQVQPGSERFWVRNRFEPIDNHTNDYRLKQ